MRGTQFAHPLRGNPESRNSQLTKMIHHNSSLAKLPGILREAFNRWIADGASEMAAALSFYTVFSLAPILIVATALAGFVFGRDAAQGQIVRQLEGLIGQTSAAAIQGMILAANRPAQGIIATIASIVSLTVGAVGVLGQLKVSLNRIWKTEEAGGVKEVVKRNAIFLSMILGIGFLLMVSLIINAALAFAGKWMSSLLPATSVMLQLAAELASLGVITVLFAAMFRILPSAKINWGDVWVGAAVTACLFSLGKFALGMYLGRSTVGSAYGAAGAILIVLLWVYYSGLIFYFGAEFTKAYSEVYGSRNRMAKAP
jgi:membrane protein